LIFVYNADSGLLNGLRDLLHKLISPQSYDCQLCALSYSALGMRREWKLFIASLAHPVLFLHADELRQRYGVAEVPLPAVFIQKGSAPEPWIDAAAINGCQSLAELQALVLARFARDS
jgi:hypothetical protein